MLRTQQKPGASSRTWGGVGGVGGLRGTMTGFRV